MASYDILLKSCRILLKPQKLLVTLVVLRHRPGIIYDVNKIGVLHITLYSLQWRQGPDDSWEQSYCPSLWHWENFAVRRALLKKTISQVPVYKMLWSAKTGQFPFSKCLFLLLKIFIFFIKVMHKI